MKNSTRWAAWLFLPVLLAAMVAVAQETRKPAPEGARLYIIAPESGATLESPVTVRFGLSGMGVAPAGMAKDATGHHHILINTDLEEVDLGKPLPATDRIRHYGGGQTEARLELAPGEYTLQLVLGDENHIPFDPPLVSEQISITVR